MNAITDFPKPQRDTLERIIVQSAEAARPPERLTVAEAAEKYRKINNPGAFVGDWSNDKTPYLVEPMNLLNSTAFTSMVFVGPAQCGKTDMAMNWIGYSAKCDPADMMVICPSNTTARDFSMRRVDRLHRHSPAFGDQLIKSRDADNVFDKHYLSGMMLTLSWPTINELSGKPIPRLWLTDYDRMDQDVDKEGDPFSLARKRATTFKSFGMTVAESSPGFEVDDPKYIPTTPHEAIPTTDGIIPLYNNGDRRRWYWRCVNPKCQRAFEPDFELLRYPDSADAMESAEQAELACPHCDTRYPHDAGGVHPSKHEMNIAGRWVKDGQVWLPDGTMRGAFIRSTTGSFWLKGVAATFASWKTLVFNYIVAERTYEANGSEKLLKSTINTDQGKPYIPKNLASLRSPEAIKSKARDNYLGAVPQDVRFLTAAIDVQKNRFVVQVMGVAMNGDRYLIDRFDIRKSKRRDSDGERFYVNPGAHPEDWKILGEEVLGKTYPLADESGRHMQIKFTVCDSGGKEGVTANAYDFYRWLRLGEQLDDDGNPVIDTSDEQGEYVWSQEFASRFLLLKGSSTPTAPQVEIRYPDSQRKDRHAGARGEIPVLFINSNMAKDTLNNALDREEPGGRINFPIGLPDTFYTELTVEIKDPSKGWINPKRFRNESWDLFAYHYATCLLPFVNFKGIHWEDPPGWAAEWDQNDLVFHPVNESKPFDAEPKKKKYDLAALANNLG